MIVLRILFDLISLACSSNGCVAEDPALLWPPGDSLRNALAGPQVEGKQPLGVRSKWVACTRGMRLGDEILRFSFELDWTPKLGLHQSPNVECLLFSTVTSSQPCIAWCFALPA